MPGKLQPYRARKKSCNVSTKTRMSAPLGFGFRVVNCEINQGTCRNELEMPQQFEFCRVCRQNHNKGRGHRYSTKHKQCLERLQGKMLERVQEIRHFVKNVVRATGIASAADQSSKFWCHFCEQDVVEKQSLFARAQAIKHLASLDHVENIKSFWAENGGDFEKQRLFVIDATDLASWEEACSRAEEAASGAVDGPPFSGGSDITQPEEEVHSTTTAHSRGILRRPISRLSEIRVPSLQPGEGNVHSGAAPPWLKKPNFSEGDNALPIEAGVSSSSELLPLSRTQQAKLSKMRNPNRVGAAWAERRRAELERERRGETLSREGEDVSSWFPSFGRVWQSGPRRDTRKEFEAEKHSELQQNLRRGRKGRLAMRNGTAKSFEFKPYVSKKQTQNLAERKNPP